jgi:hypothetical protein
MNRLSLQGQSEILPAEQKWTRRAATPHPDPRPRSLAVRVMMALETHCNESEFAVFYDP